MTAVVTLRSDAPRSEASKLLTENDVARMLRCPIEKVRRRRRKGLAFIPGRPVTIAEADLFAYLDTIKVRARTTPPSLAVQESNAAADTEAARARARKAWIRRRLAGA